MLEEITDLQQKDIAILTPWREQVWRMRTRLRKLGLGGVDVGNIEVSYCCIKLNLDLSRKRIPSYHTELCSVEISVLGRG